MSEAELRELRKELDTYKQQVHQGVIEIAKALHQLEKRLERLERARAPRTK